LHGSPLSREHALGEESAWAEFTSFQVRRTTTPRRQQVAGRSVDEETSQTSQFVPHIKLNAVNRASTESEHVDVDGIRREKFRQRNVHGHSSDSSVARLLYSQSSPAVQPIPEVIETGYPITFDFVV